MTLDPGQETPLPRRSPRRAGYLVLGAVVAVAVLFVLLGLNKHAAAPAPAPSAPRTAHAPEVSDEAIAALAEADRRLAAEPRSSENDATGVLRHFIAEPSTFMALEWRGALTEQAIPPDDDPAGHVARFLWDRDIGWRVTIDTFASEAEADAAYAAILSGSARQLLVPADAPGSPYLMHIKITNSETGVVRDMVCAHLGSRFDCASRGKDMAAILTFHASTDLNVGDDIEPISGAIAHDLDEAARILSGLGVTQNAQ